MLPPPLLPRKDLVRLMMNKIFQSIETELHSLIALGYKIDSFHSLYMLVKMSHHVWTAENVDPASYLSTTLGNVLVTVKRNFDKCIVSGKGEGWVPRSSHIFTPSSSLPPSPGLLCSPFRSVLLCLCGPFRSGLLCLCGPFRSGLLCLCSPFRSGRWRR